MSSQAIASCWKSPSITSQSKRGNSLSIAEQAQSTGLTQQELNAIETLYRAFNERNPDLLDEACCPDWQDIPLSPGQEPGRDGFKKLMPVFFAAFPDLKLEIHEVIGSHGRAGVRLSLVGTHRGELFGVAASNQQVRVAFHEFHHLLDGRLTHTWHLEDWFGMFQHIGHYPPVSTV